MHRESMRMHMHMHVHTRFRMYAKHAPPSPSQRLPERDLIIASATVITSITSITTAIIIVALFAGDEPADAPGGRK